MKKAAIILFVASLFAFWQLGPTKIEIGSDLHLARNAIFRHGGGILGLPVIPLDPKVQVSYYCTRLGRSYSFTYDRETEKIESISFSDDSRVIHLKVWEWAEEDEIVWTTAEQVTVGEFSWVRWTTLVASLFLFAMALRKSRREHPNGKTFDQAA